MGTSEFNDEGDPVMDSGLVLQKLEKALVL